MDDYSSDSARDELLQRFRDELKRPLAERFYSEEELISIFDSAGDAYDDYVRAEVLMLGARLYPDSHQLLERRGIFYESFEFDALPRFVADHAEMQSTLADIMRLNTVEGSGLEFAPNLDDFIATHTLHEDEEVIQFVQMVHAHHADKWLYDHLDLVKSKVHYLPTLYYEIAVNAEMDGDTAASIDALTALTDLEPYNADYWTMLASAHIAADSAEEAAQAVDYALAINPSHPEALKAKLRLTDDVDIQMTLFDKLLEINPADAEIALAALQHAEEHDIPGRVDSLLALTVPAVRGSFSLAAQAIIHDYPDLDGMLDDLFAANSDAENWRSLADVAYRHRHAEAVARIMQIYERKSEKSLNHDFLLFKILFEMKHYEVAVNMFINADEGGTLRRTEHLYECFAVFIISLLRMGQVADAVAAADNMLQMLKGGGDMPGTAVERYGMIAFLKDVKRRAHSKNPTDWEKYNPLGV